MKNILVIACALVFGIVSANGNPETQRITRNTRLYTVEEIQNAFRTNAIDAEDQFSNKEILVKGRMYSVRKDGDDGYELKLDHMKERSIFTLAMECEFSSEKRNQLKGLQRGDVIVVKGIVKDAEEMEDCEIVDRK